MLRVLCEGSDDSSAADHREQAADAGAIEAVVAVLLARPEAATLQEAGFNALAVVCLGTGGGGRARKLRAVDAGAARAAVATIGAHTEGSTAHREAGRSLVSVCAGLTSLGKQRQQRLADVGALEAIVAQLTAPSANGETPRFKAGRYKALRNLTSGNAELQKMAMALGARKEWF